MLKMHVKVNHSQVDLIKFHSKNSLKYFFLLCTTDSFIHMTRSLNDMKRSVKVVQFKTSPSTTKRTDWINAWQCWNTHTLARTHIVLLETGLAPVSLSPSRFGCERNKDKHTPKSVHSAAQLKLHLFSLRSSCLADVVRQPSEYIIAAEELK